MDKFMYMHHNNKYRNIKKISYISINDKNSTLNKKLKKPSWIKIKLYNDESRIKYIKNIIRENGLHSVCEEASCPNLTECFNNSAATFMILGDICTRRCPFCNVTHGRPKNPDINEPEKLAKTIYDLKLNYVVITSVNRDDLQNGGAQHFSDCINAIRIKNPSIIIEILVPDFRRRVNCALNIINSEPPDIFNHNLESVPRLYRKVRPHANYKESLKLLKRFKNHNPNIPTKSGLMVGLGETNIEILKVIKDLYLHGVTMLTVGQYLQPSKYHLPVDRYLNLKEFENIKKEALDIGFTYAACGPLVRSSYNSYLQYKKIEIK